MPTTIDADTHVDETEDTWAYLLASEQGFKPTVVVPDRENRPQVRHWVIDGERQPRLTRNDEKTRTTVEARELLDVKLRVRDMDSLDVQTQVIYPTTFLIQPTARPEVDLALKRSYNRWLADRCADSGGRLLWVCLPPVMNMKEAVKEVRWAKDHGAVGVSKKGNQEGGKVLTDPYFYDLWEVVNDLDMAVCIHTGSGIPNLRANREAAGSNRVPFASLPDAFTSLVLNKIPQKYPRIRWGFIEAASGWIPHELYKIGRRLGHPGEQQRSDGLLTLNDLPEGFDINRDALKELNLFVTCQVDEDLPYILQFAGEDNLVIGSDYTHADQSMERNFQDVLRARVDAGDLSATALDKMLYDNPKRLYGL
jgi:predicted TIM-barrel fold metal-dependent hydrolase